MNNTEEWKVVKNLLHDALDFAECSKRFTIDDPEEGLREDKAVSLAYAAACTAKYSAAQAIYTLYPGVSVSLSRLFAAFDSFTREVLSSYADNHSTQQVLTCYGDLEDIYNELFSNR